MMQCPNCKGDYEDNLEILCTTTTRVFVDRESNVTGSSDPGEGFQWDDNTPAQCSECAWSGKVKDLYIENQTPKTLTREEAIEELTDMRLEEHDDDDRREWLIEGRIGFKEMSNAELAELYANFTNQASEDVVVTGQEPEPTVEVKKAEHDKQADTYKQMLDALKLLQAVKGPVTFEDGWATLEDGTEICLNDLIAQAEWKE